VERELSVMELGCQVIEEVDISDLGQDLRARGVQHLGEKLIPLARAG
jgi:hypothetical protein